MRKFIPDPPHTFARHSWGKTVAYVCVGLCLIGIGVLAGFFAGRDSKPAGSTTSSSITPVTSRAHAVDISPDGLVEMPEYDSPEAAAMMSDPATPDTMRDMYFMWKDSQQVTPQLTRAFIQATRQQLAANQQLLGGRDPETIVDWKTLDRIARDVLGYLRYTRSVAILDLLRRFCASGGVALSITDSDPDALRQEISALLNMTTLNDYFAKMSDKGCDRSSNRRKPRGVGNILRVMGSSATSEQASAGRHLAQYHHEHHHHHHHHQRVLLQTTSSQTRNTGTTTSAATSRPRCFNTTAGKAANFSRLTGSSNLSSSAANASQAAVDDRAKRRGGGSSLGSILSSESAGQLPRRHLLQQDPEHHHQQRTVLQQEPPASDTAQQAAPQGNSSSASNASQAGDDDRERRRDGGPSLSSILSSDAAGPLPRRHLLQDDHDEHPLHRTLQQAAQSQPMPGGSATGRQLPATNTTTTTSTPSTAAAGLRAEANQPRAHQPRNASVNATETADSVDARLRRRSDVEPSMDAIVYPELGSASLPRRHLMHHDDQHIHHQHLQRQQQRRLQQVPPAVANTTAANATRNPTSTTAAGLNATAAEAAEAAAEAVLTPEDIQEMICAVRSYSPVDLRGISNVTCPSSRSRVINAPFGNLTIPIVFHCYRWASEQGMLLPPMWDSAAAARNLVAVTNKYFAGSGIQFELREVRTDPFKYPYLLFDSLAEWQQCSRNDAATDQGMVCLREEASHPNVSSLTADYVINIFITGSSLVPIYCKETDAWYSVCNSQALGFANPYGPWFGANSDPNWREGLVTEEWFWMQYDMFAPHIRNNYRFWDAGACTMAHELAHYLGLRHTHQGSCGGNGVQATDAVADTPANMEFWTFADTVPGKHLVTQLQEWCSMFREGQEPRPQMRELTGFSSCPTVNPERAAGDVVVDNVFNMMSYLPDACCMAMSRGQIIRMQDMIMRYRPGMVARHATGAE